MNLATYQQFKRKLPIENQLKQQNGFFLSTEFKKLL